MKANQVDVEGAVGGRLVVRHARIEHNFCPNKKNMHVVEIQLRRSRHQLLLKTTP
jgi:hypothetical protein